MNQQVVRHFMTQDPQDVGIILN